LNELLKNSCATVSPAEAGSGFKDTDLVRWPEGQHYPNGSSQRAFQQAV